MGIEQHIDILMEVADAATKEFSLEKALQKMFTETSQLKFDVIPYKYVLRDVIRLGKWTGNMALRVYLAFFRSIFYMGVMKGK